MELIKKRIKSRIAELEKSRDSNIQGQLAGLQEALQIIKQVEQEKPREAWGDY